MAPLILNFGTRLEQSAFYPGCFTARGRAPNTHQTGGWVGSRMSPDVLEK